MRSVEILLPENQEAEQWLLASILAKNDRYLDVQDVVSADDFYFGVHREIFKKISEFIADGKEASPVTLRAWFESHPDLPDSQYLRDLAGGGSGFCNVTEYAKIVSEVAERRRLMIIMESALENLKNPDVSSGELRANLSSMLEKNAKSFFSKTKRQVAEESIRAMQMPTSCFPTGLGPLDHAMAGGLYHGYTYGLCAPEKRGKTTFAHTISENLNNHGVDHAYIAMEMGSVQIEQRNIARAIGQNSMAFLSKNKSPDIISKAARHAASVKDHTIYLDMPGCSFSQIKAELVTLVARKKIKGFILDYWQLVTGGEKGQSKADFLFDVAQWFANFARRHGLWCIILGQLNREGNVFGSAGLEKACDQLYFIEKTPNEEVTQLYLKMTHSRYTPLCDVGHEGNPRFQINRRVGPFIEAI